MCKKVLLGDDVVKALADRHLPNLLRMNNGEAVTLENWEAKKEELQAVVTEMYGIFPEEVMSVSAKEVESVSILDGKGTEKQVELTLTGKKGTFTFRIAVLMPTLKANEKAGAFILICGADVIEGDIIPEEELCERGYAVFSINAPKVAGDNDDFDTGITPFLYEKEDIDARKMGKFVIWAYAASRVLDYILTLDEIDPERIAVVGHSRMGKTALVAAAYDERINYAIGNNSGCCGAALIRGKEGETLADITRVFPYWFAKGFEQYAGRSDDLPFDQTALLALIVPRYLYNCSSVEDAWSDPYSEFLGAASVNELYELFGKDGFIADKFPEVGGYYHEGCSGYHLRSGNHAMIYEDWHRFMDFIETHK